MKLSSPAFPDKGDIPEKYGYTKDNVNPPVEFSDVPEEAESLVLVVDDPDAVEPAGKVWDHWLMWDIPEETERIGEGEKPIGAVEGKNDFGDKSYGGPNPPDREHIYRFRLYALDKELDLESNTGKKQLLNQIEENIIEQTKLEGSFKPV